MRAFDSMRRDLDHQRDLAGMDAVTARSRAKDVHELLYRTLQIAVRQTLGKRSLEEVLADKVDIDASVSAEVGEPGRVDAAAGSRYIEIPVSITATRRDGSVHRYAGAYTLRRAVVDGASADQRAWRIASADLREVRP